MDKNTLLQAIRRKATQFTTGGFRPTNTSEESWIGRVFIYKAEEELPLDSDGRPMIPLAQFYLPALPFVPESLQGFEYITVFLSTQFPDPFDSMGNRWVIRTYTATDEIIEKEFPIDTVYIKAFPLQPSLVEQDCPLWDGGGLTTEQEDAFLALEEEGIIEGYYEETTHSYLHKIGGWPSFCQSGVDFEEGYSFVFQLSTDAKANLNVVDNGSFLFAFNPSVQQWQLYYDFY